LVSDIPAGDGKLDNLFLRCIVDMDTYVRCYDEEINDSYLILSKHSTINGAVYSIHFQMMFTQMGPAPWAQGLQSLLGRPSHMYMIIATSRLCLQWRERLDWFESVYLFQKKRKRKKEKGNLRICFKLSISYIYGSCLLICG
jgi:hypothetical protein